MTKHRTRASPRQTADAIAVLHEIATDPLAADHARGNAARALLNGVKRETDDADKPDDDEQATPVILLMPTNHRDPGLTRLGISRGEGNFYRIDFDDSNPEGLRALDRWQAEIAAEIATLGFEPSQAPVLALPPQAPKSAAERQRAYRQRRREALDQARLATLEIVAREHPVAS